MIASSLLLVIAAQASWGDANADSWGGWSTTGGGGITHTFHLLAGSTGPNDLSSDLVIGGVATTLTNSCIGTSAGLTCTTAVADAGAGTAATTTILTASHAFDSTERGVVFGSGQKRLDPATSSTWDLGTQDFFVEGVIQSPASGAVILDKSLASTAGWSLTMNGTTAVRLSLRTGSVTTTVDGPSNNPSTSRFHFICFVDRSEASTNGSACYADGVQGTGVNMSARVATATNAVVASVGAISGGTSTVSTILELKTWVCTACAVGGAPNLTEWAPIARDRAAIANGVSPLIAAGSRIPTTMARASIANVDVVDGETRMLYTLGNAGMRVAKRAAASVAVTGFMPELAGTNIALQSQTLGTTWTFLDVGDNVLADAFAGADRTTTGDNLDGDNTGASEHGFRQNVTLTAATYTFSSWAKAGEQSFVYLRDATIANGTGWFDISECDGSGAIGEDWPSAATTKQAGVSRSSISEWPVDTTGDGVADVTLCRAEIVFVGTAAAHNLDMGCAPSDNVTTYTDSGAAADCGFWGAQLEVSPRATSYIATTTVGVTRAGDTLDFAGAGNYTGSPTTMDTSVLCSTYTPSGFVFLGGMAPTSALTTVFLHGNITSNGNGRSVGAVNPTTHWDLNNTPSLNDGAAHSMRTTAATNNIEFFIDGVTKGTDVAASLPDASSPVEFIGPATPQTANFNPNACLISSLRLYSGLYTPAQVP